jgi:hypothetical protein
MGCEGGRHLLAMARDGGSAASEPELEQEASHQARAKSQGSVGK